MRGMIRLLALCGVMVSLASGCGRIWSFPENELPAGFGIGGGPLASVRTDLGSGTGWTAVASVSGRYDRGYDDRIREAVSATRADLAGDEASEDWGRTFRRIEMSQPLYNAFRRIEVSRVAYPQEDGADEVVLLRFSMDAAFQDAPEVFLLGLAFHAGTGDIWGFGPRIGYGLGLFRQHFELYVMATAYLWLGERDDAVVVGAEADVRLGLGFRL